MMHTTNLNAVILLKINGSQIYKMKMFINFLMNHSIKKKMKKLRN